MKKKLMIAGPAALVLLLVAYMMFLKPSAPAPDEKALAKEPGPVYTLTDPFVVNLADREPRLAKVGVALQLSKLSAPLLPEGTAKEPAKMEQDAAIRDIVIAALQERRAAELRTPAGRDAVKKAIVTMVNKKTEVKIVDVYYTEFAVQ